MTITIHNADSHLVLAALRDQAREIRTFNSTFGKNDPPSLREGLEVGCKVLIKGWDGRPGEVLEINHERGESLLLPDPPADTTSGRAWWFHDSLERDYDEAQATRQRRFGILHEHFGGDAGVPEETDTIERYVMVQRDQAGEVVYHWGGTFDDAVQDGGARVAIDREQIPEGVYDLDTGKKIDVHPRAILVPDDEQGNSINELNHEEVAASRKFVEEHYDEVAVAFHISATVPPEHAEAFKEQIDEILNGPLTEWAALQAERIRQMRPDTADKLKAD